MSRGFVAKTHYGSDKLLISSDTVQTNFNVTKYQNIFYSNDAGLLMKRQIEAAWPAFRGKVDEAPWLRNFGRSRFFLGPGSGYDTEAIARALLAEAVWGFGSEGWVPRFTTGSKSEGPFASICSLQELRSPNMLRTWLWDTPILLGTGMYIPCEFGTLDRWLDSLHSSM